MSQTGGLTPRGSLSSSYSTNIT